MELDTSIELVRQRFVQRSFRYLDSKDTNAILQFYHFYLGSEVAFDQKADTEEQREDVEGGDYFWKVLVDLDREVRQEVDEEEVAGKRHEVELDSVG